MTGFLVVRKSDGYMFEAPEISAMTHFDDLAPDFPVWCTVIVDGKPKPVVVPRGELVRLSDVLQGSE